MHLGFYYFSIILKKSAYQSSNIMETEIEIVRIENYVYYLPISSTKMLKRKKIYKSFKLVDIWTTLILCLVAVIAVAMFMLHRKFNIVNENLTSNSTWTNVSTVMNVSITQTIASSTDFWNYSTSTDVSFTTTTAISTDILNTTKPDIWNPIPN